jgi:hypothetical protein
MIRNTVVHLANEQPLLADLYRMPDPGDVALVCTNLRMKNGERPIFADDSRSTFVFPLVFVRFVEIPESAMAGVQTGQRDPGVLALSAGRTEETTPAAAAARGAATGTSPERPGEPAPTATDADLEIDEEFLRRIRDA